MEWQYKIVECGHSSHKGTEEFLNGMGTKRWELISITDQQKELFGIKVYTFKRPRVRGV